MKILFPYASKCWILTRSLASLQCIISCSLLGRISSFSLPVTLSPFLQGLFLMLCPSASTAFAFVKKKIFLACLSHSPTSLKPLPGSPGPVELTTMSQALFPKSRVWGGLPTLFSTQSLFLHVKALAVTISLIGTIYHLCLFSECVPVPKSLFQTLLTQSSPSYFH